MATSKKPNTVEIVTQLAQPVVEEMGLQLWDVRFEKEGASWYLRLFIDKEGGVTIDDYFEVSSPGIGRDLVRPWHFERYLGQDVEVKMIRPMQTAQGKTVREFVGTLTKCDEQNVWVTLEGEELSFAKKDAAYIRLYEEIDWKNAKI